MDYIRGDEIEVTVDREGLGLDEGIGHMADDTMVVVVGGGGKVGESVRATIIGTHDTPLGQSIVANAIV